MVSRGLRTVLLFLALIVIICPAGRAAASSHFMIQVVGDFNAWDPYSPAMTPISASQWADTLNVDVGCTFIKFRTDFVWETTPDYGRCSGEEGPCQVQVPTDGPLVLDVCLGSGAGNALGEVEFPESADYEFILDEQIFTCTIRQMAGVPVESVSWGRVKALYR